MVTEETICAISTPAGSGAIAVVRISGDKAIHIADSLFRFPSGKGCLADQAPNTIHFGHIHDGGRMVDEVLVGVFRAPRSYTGEDLLEISCHGSHYIQQEILQLLLRQGARLARPGEFTLRAFLNGKMDLSQAEAVADLIASGSEAAHRLALHQMRGGFSGELQQLREQLLQFASLVELELDFSDEDVEFADRPELKKLVKHIHRVTGQLADSFSLGNAIKNGVPVAIVGKPNVGKSTLLNALLKEDRAIVSEVAGTTRDAIEDTVNLEGITFRFIDTAGIRETSDYVENLGIRKTYQKIEQATTVLLLVDATDPLDIICRSYRHILSQNGSDNRRIILVINKSDKLPAKGLKKKFNPSALSCLRQTDDHICLSAKEPGEVHELALQLLGMIKQDRAGKYETIISNVRHYEALKHTEEALGRVIRNLNKRLPGDLLAQDIRQALHYLGEITGAITTDEILGNIFSKFCIGK